MLPAAAAPRQRARRRAPRRPRARSPRAAGRTQARARRPPAAARAPAAPGPARGRRTTRASAPSSREALDPQQPRVLAEHQAPVRLPVAVRVDLLAREAPTLPGLPAVGAPVAV